MSYMVEELVKDNFDINVYNRGADMSTILPPEEAYTEWMLCPYRLEWDGTNYSISDEMESLNLVLTQEEYRALTLGLTPKEGGDYYGDDDFWIDSNSFKDTYKSIPKSIRTWLDFVTYNL